MNLSVSEMFNILVEDCWDIEASTIQTEDMTIKFKVCIACGVQARGRFRTCSTDFKTAVEDVFEEIREEWGDV